MVLEFLVPSVHAVDLVRVIFLSRALGDVTLGPFAVTSGDLLDTDGGVLTVVSVEVEIIVLTSLALGTTVGEVVGVVVAASLVATVEVALHTLGVVGELADPGLLRWQEVEPVVQDLGRELGQLGQSLERVSWWDLLVLGGGNGEKKSS